MSTRPRLLVLSTLVLLCAAAVPFLTRSSQAAGGDSSSAPSDAPLAEPRARLLDLAFESASALPLNPHVKNRSRAQDGVVAACLELDQPQRARVFAEAIANWRRGACLADYALWCARNGHPEEANRVLPLAAAVVREQEQAGEDADTQEWRRDRIRARMAETLRALGRPQEAVPLEAGLEPSESGRIEAVRARTLAPEGFEDELVRVDQVVRSGNLDQVRNALSVVVELHGRFFDDPERRAAAAAKLEEHKKQLPRGVVLDLFADLSGQCVEHGDLQAARAWADAAAQLVADPGSWELDLLVALRARVARLRHACGDEAAARRTADDAFVLYLERRTSLVDMFRAEALRPLAEAYVALGLPEAARRVYAQALDEAVLNPNSRPRAMDLSALCCSIAVSGLEPDEDLWKRIRAVRDGLGDPW